ncbi:MAG: hemin uptake protein HemP [Planctomycetia bacterium]
MANMQNPSTPSSDRPSPPLGSTPTSAGTAAVPSADLLSGRTELLIRHGDDLYRLRVTRHNKLILTK